VIAAVFNSMRSILIYILFIFALSSCAEQCEKNCLPPPSQNGSHKLGFFLNNKTWVPKDKGFHKEFELPQPTIGEDGLVKISATRVDDENYCRNWFCIEVQNPDMKTGVFPISNETCKNAYQTYYYGKNKDKASLTYDIIQTEKNEIEFTKFDLDENIIAGNFSFTAVSNLSDTIRISQGRFDLKLKE